METAIDKFVMNSSLSVQLHILAGFES